MPLPGEAWEAAMRLLARCRRLLGVRPPRRIVEVEALPRGQCSKFARKALTERFESLAGASPSAG